MKQRLRLRSVALPLAVILLAALVSETATYAMFNAKTTSNANGFATGTVVLSDNDAGGMMISLSNARPSASSNGCIAVASTGSLDSSVRLYATVGGTLAPYLNLTVTRGTMASPSFPGCAGFAADGTNYLGAGAGVVFTGTLSAYPTDWAAGIVDAPGSSETWTTNEVHVYRIAITLANNPAAQGLSSSATFTWEARNL